MIIREDAIETAIGNMWSAESHRRFEIADYIKKYVNLVEIS